MGLLKFMRRKFAATSTLLKNALFPLRKDPPPPQQKFHLIPVHLFLQINEFIRQWVLPVSFKNLKKWLKISCQKHFVKGRPSVIVDVFLYYCADTENLKHI